MTSQLDKLSRDAAAWRFVRERVLVQPRDIEGLFRAIDDLRRVVANGSPWREISVMPAGVTSAALAEVQFDILDVTTATLRGRSVGADVGYFGPLVRAPIAGIATLNFDTLVERAAAEHGALLSTGADAWDGGFHWPLPPDGTALLKLHGSLDWIQEIRKGGPIPITGRRTLSPSDENRFGGGGIFSPLRFGLENKLTEEGPMPALLEAFRRLLENSELVIAVGYSFRDEHIDAVLNRWAALDDTRRLIVVDPMRDPDDLDALERSGSSWFRQMVAGIRDDVFPGRMPRLDIVSESAETAFRALF